jgi:PAS domain S-box-containing protein
MKHINDISNKSREELIELVNLLNDKSAKLEDYNKEALKRYELIGDHIPGAIYQYRLYSNGTSCFPYCSIGIKNIYGVTPEEVLNDATPVFKVIHPEDLERVNKLIFESASNLTVWRDTYRVNLSEEKTIWVEGFATPQKLDDGSILWHGYLHDFTQIINYQQELINTKKIAEANEFRLKLAIDSGGFGVWDWSVKENTMLWNKRMYELYGIDESLFTNNLDVWTNGLHPDDKDRALDDCNSALFGNKEFDLTFRVVHPDGKILFLKANGVVIKDHNDDPVRMIGINRDITESIQAENEIKKRENLLRESKILLQSIIDSTEDLVWSVDLNNFELLSYNKAFIRFFSKILGVDVKIGMTPTELLKRKELYDLWYGFYDNAINNGNFIKEYKLSTTDMYLLLNFNLLIKDEKIFGISVFGKDITDIKRKEKELLDYQENLELMVDERTLALTEEIKLRKTIEKELSDSEKRYRDLVDKSTSIVLEWDTSGEIVFLNRYGLEFFGYKEKEIIGKNVLGTIVEAFDETGEDLESKMKIVQKQPENFYSSENQNIKKSGEKVWIAWTNKRINNEKGELIKTLSVGLDRTKQHDMEKALIQYQNKLEEMVEARTTELSETNKELIISKEKAEQSDRLKSAFLKNMSHEIRTPISGIIGFVELLSQSEVSDDERKYYSEIVNKSSERLMNTINDIIEISKIESGDMSAKLQEVDLHELMAFYYDFFNPQATRAGIKLFIGKQVETRDSLIISDRQKIDGIMMNLLKNALKFTMEGYIEFGNYIENDFINFYVKDTGIGIPEDKKEDIFNCFVQVNIELNRHYEGSGIGLSIVKAYVKSLNGEINLESELGKGSIFTISIPYMPCL